MPVSPDLWILTPHPFRLDGSPRPTTEPPARGRGVGLARCTWNHLLTLRPVGTPADLECLKCLE
jgi:hypothetical protein